MTIKNYLYILDISSAPKKRGMSIFAQAVSNKKQCDVKQSEPMELDDIATDDKRNNLVDIYGKVSVIVEDSQTAEEIHKENLNLLCKMKEEEIMAERKKLMESIGKLYKN